MKPFSFSSLLLSALLLASAPALAQQMRKTEWGSGMQEKRNKVGVWEYYATSRDGSKVVVQRYDHTTNKLVYFQPGGDDPVYVEAKPNEWRWMRVSQPPLYLGGVGLLGSYMRDLVYPPSAQERGLQGKVIVAVTIDTVGHVQSLKMVHGIGAECDAEAMRVAKAIPETWIPARIGSHAVPSQFELPFVFRLATAP